MFESVRVPVNRVFTWSRLAVSAADVPAQSCVNVIRRQGALEGAGLLCLHGAGGGAGDVAGARARPAVGGERRPGGRAVQTHRRLTGSRRHTCAQAAQCALLRAERTGVTQWRAVHFTPRPLVASHLVHLK